MIEAPDPAKPEPLQRQLYDALRSAIMRGRLRPGTRLPSTRELRAQLGLSRNTVLAVFERLLADGYLETRPGSGTYVASRLPDELLTQHATPARMQTGGRAGAPSTRGTALLHAAATTFQPTAGRPFQPGVPALAEFPNETWAQVAARVRRRVPRELLAYGDPAGHRPLREAIASRLRSARAVNCDAGQVLIVNGAQQGLYLAALVLLDPGDRAWTEDPGDPGVRGAMQAAGARPAPVPVDAEGLDVEAGVRLCPTARLACVSPSHLSPLGVTMSLRRRLGLLEWARETGAWVVEHDSDGEYRHAGRSPASLQGLDQDGRVIYAGTLSMVMFPALRLGYLVVPEALVAPFTAAQALIERHSPTIAQAELAEFIAGGHFDRHVRRMHVLYQHRQDVLVRELTHQTGSLLEVQPASGGMQLLCWLPAGADDQEVARAAARRHVTAVPLSSSYVGGVAPRPALVLGYAAYADAAIRHAVSRLRAALEETVGRCAP